MTSKITIGNYSNIKPSAVKWKCGVGNFTDECTIDLPLRTYTRDEYKQDYSYPNGSTERSITALADDKRTVFKEGDSVEVWLGYDARNTLRFKGFVKRINYAKPLVLECEGYNYQLKDIVFNKSYKNATVRQILADLIQGTDIKLSAYIPNIVLSNATFSKFPAQKVLEWFVKECHLAIFFDFDTLYVGHSKQGISKPTVKLQLGWNTADDKELKKDVSDSDIQIQLVEKSSAGSVKRTQSDRTKYGNVKEVKVRQGMADGDLKKIANELQNAASYRGYTGSITCFLMPSFEKCYVAQIIDKQFPDRNGKFFVEQIDGSFNSSGGRQKLTLRYYAEN
jgi:hypothetical protein